MKKKLTAVVIVSGLIFLALRAWHNHEKFINDVLEDDDRRRKEAEDITYT